MLQKIKNITPADTWIASAILLSVSMIFSPFLLSVGMWALVATAIWEIRRQTTNASWGHTIKVSLQHLTQNKALLALTLLFWVFAISGLWSSDISFWLARTRIRIPFLVLPWAFANAPQMSFKRYSWVIYGLVISLCLFSAGALLNFALDPETILSGLGEGQPVPVPRNHIRFSLMIVTAIVSGGWLVGKASVWKSNTHRWWFAAAIVFLFLALHLFSVRSALIALYAALGFTIFRFLFRTKQWKTGLIALAMILVMPIIAINTVSSLKKRIAYMLYDWQHFRSAQGGENYSDSERFISLDIGVRIWLEQPVLGTGIGDLEKATAEMTAKAHPHYAETPKLPHNQFIYLLASTGVIGGLLSLWALLYATVRLPWRGFYVFAVFQVIVFISFLVEYTLETAIGAAFYLFYQLWWIKMAEAYTNPTDTAEV